MIELRVVLHNIGLVYSRHFFSFVSGRVLECELGHSPRGLFRDELDTLNDAIDDLKSRTTRVEREK